MQNSDMAEDIWDRPADRLEPRPGSLEDLYVRHIPEAVRLAYLLTRDGGTAEDLAQDAFIKVAGRFRSLRSPGAFDAYLRKAVVNLGMSHHRRTKVARSYVRRETARTDGREATTSFPDVETRLELHSALATLPDRQRTAVILRFYSDLSEDQVAHALGCSVTAARSLVFRAMGTLRSLIGGDEG